MTRGSRRHWAQITDRHCTRSATWANLSIPGQAGRGREDVPAGTARKWGPDHASTLNTVNNLGNLYMARASWTRPRRCTSGHCKERRRHGAQIIWTRSTTWATSTKTRASWTRPRRCTSGHYKERRRHGAQIIHQHLTRSTTWAFSTRARASWTRPRRCTSGHCKERRRHGAQIIHQHLDTSTTWAFSTNPRASWTRPRRCTSGHCKEGRRHGAQITHQHLNTVNNLGNLYKSQGKLDEAEKDVPAGTTRKGEGMGPRSYINT